MDKEKRFKVGISRFFKSTYASCRSRILSETTTNFGSGSKPIIPLSSIISPTSFRSVIKPSNLSSKSMSNSQALFYYPQSPPTDSPVSSLILDREFYHNPKSKKQNKTKKKMANSERKFSSRSRRLAAVEIASRSDDDSNESNDEFLSARSRSSSDWSNDTTKDSIVAVVKSSNDPYEDFRTSMVEMIVDKQILNGQDLEMLLQCFLELNSRHHHRVILNVFAEILEALFGQCD